MKKICLLVMLLFAVSLLSGCVMRAPVVPPTGLVYADHTAPLDITLKDTNLGPREGRAKTTTILGLVSFGDSGIQAAARDGNITTITGADYHYYSVLGVFTEYTTIVYGH